MEKNFIPFHKPFITDEEISGVTDTIRSGWLTTGPKVQQFEKQFTAYIGSRRAVTANSWTAAAHLALEAIGLQAGDEVIVPAITFTSTAEVVCYFNARPVIVDVDRDTLNILPESIEKALSPRTKCIIPVHYGGLPCDLDEISAIAGEKKIRIIEDAAHALPARYRGKMIGTVSDVTCFSFYATKPLAMGEGGMICTEDEAIADRCSIMRLHGISRDAWQRYTKEGSWYYEVVSPGFKYNLTDIQAALGLAQLNKIDRLRDLRKEIARRYDEAFKGEGLIKTPAKLKDRESSYHLYAVQLNVDALTISRSQFIEKLKEIGIGTSVHFIPLYRHPFYRDTYDLKEEAFPNSEHVFPRLLSLPIWPGMTDSEVERVIDGVSSILGRYKS